MYSSCYCPASVLFGPVPCVVKAQIVTAVSDVTAVKWDCNIDEFLNLLTGE
jgi:hypothetical protein